MKYKGTCSAGPMHGEPLEHDRDFYIIMRHPGTVVGIYKFLGGYDGVWAWVEYDGHP